MSNPAMVLNVAPNTQKYLTVLTPIGSILSNAFCFYLTVPTVLALQTFHPTPLVFLIIQNKITTLAHRIPLRRTFCLTTWTFVRNIVIVISFGAE